MKTGTKILTAIGAAAVLLGAAAVIMHLCFKNKRRYFPVSKISFNFAKE